MKISKLTMIMGGIIMLLLGAGIARAISGGDSSSVLSVAGPVTSGISYQGQLTNPGGGPLNGTYAMRFIIYDAPAGGSAVWDSGTMNIAVENSLFNVILNVDQADFDGRALWLSIAVDGETLSPRQELLPAPYALSLRPGADIVGDAISAGDAILAGYAPATGTALFADAHGGAGIFADSESSYGIWGSSNNSWGGYFSSENGHGIRVDTNGSDIYDHGAYITSNWGYGVYAQSEHNQALRGEAGNVTGFAQPLGPVGVVGIGQSRGVYGSSGNGPGAYGTSSGNYGVWGQSNTYRGVTGRTDRPDNNYGIYTPDNFFALNITTAGSIMQVMQNNGLEPLSAGDVVVFSGIDQTQTAVDGPMVQVSKTDMANSTAVAGVVFSRFNIDAVDPDLEASDNFLSGAAADMEVTPAGSAAPGDYVLVVVQGPAQVKTSALGGTSIQPGELLSTSTDAGVAAKAEMAVIDGMAVPIPGRVFAKALEPVQDGKQELIYVYVTLQ
jgi:hypothetical protein